VLSVKTGLDGVKGACPDIAKDNADRCECKKNGFLLIPPEGLSPDDSAADSFSEFADDINNLRKLSGENNHPGRIRSVLLIEACEVS